MTFSMEGCGKTLSYALITASAIPTLLEAKYGDNSSDKTSLLIYSSTAIATFVATKCIQLFSEGYAKTFQGGLQNPIGINKFLKYILFSSVITGSSLLIYSMAETCMGLNTTIKESSNPKKISFLYGLTQLLANAALSIPSFTLTYKSLFWAYKNQNTLETYSAVSL